LKKQAYRDLKLLVGSVRKRSPQADIQKSLPKPRQGADPVVATWPDQQQMLALLSQQGRWHALLDGPVAVGTNMQLTVVAEHSIYVWEAVSWRRVGAKVPIPQADAAQWDEQHVAEVLASIR
jgi:hypothetical protein